jgi:DNA polymerase-3 subunit alpha
MPEASAPNGPAKGLPAKPAPAPSGGADGDVSMVMMLDLQTEVEMKLPGRFKVSPQIAGAIKAVPAWSTCRRCRVTRRPRITP